MLKNLSGLMLIPFCVGFTWQFGRTLFTAAYKPGLPYYFFGGALAYLVIHLLFRKPIFTYVFGHELTHALFAVLFGGSVRSFQASERGGRVTITKSNFIITLAPYFFPLYAWAALVLYWIALAAGLTGVLGWLIFFVGAGFAFHLTLTFIFLQTDQADIREHGAAFSYPLIYLFNVLFAALLISVLLVENASFLRFLINGIMKSVEVIAVVFTSLGALIQNGYQRI